ncbi:MAG: hypothetical protein ACYDDF_05280 [Thermoplasmatota archaeon]
MLGFAPNPGSIRYQLGKSVTLWQDAIRDGDIGIQADLIGAAITVCSPKLGKEDRKELLERLDDAGSAYARSGRDRDGAATRAFLRACEDVMADLLRACADAGLYAYKEPELGQGGAELAEPLGDFGGEHDTKGTAEEET